MCVRVTGLNGVNLRRFEFDYDTTWAAFFLDADLNVYSRYGGRDEEGPEARMNPESLLHTMREVLGLHAQGTSAAPAEPIHQPVPKESSTPEDIPLLKQNHNGCVHCHQAREYQILQEYHVGRFDREDLFVYPLPESVGLKLDLRHGHRIAEVLPNTPAGKSGFAAGDVIVRLDSVPVHSEFDIRWALHRSEPDQTLRVTVERTAGTAQERHTLTLTPPAGWRQTDLSWRKSMRSVPLAVGFRAYSLGRSQRKPLDLPEGRMAIQVISLRGGGLAESLGLEKRDVIVALEDDDRDLSFEELQSDLIRRYRPGDTVRVVILREGRRLALSGRFPEWHTEETSVP